MRIAYCVMCHKYTPVLRELVAQAGHRNDIYLHVDAKTDIAQFDGIRDFVNLVEPRIDVAWGGYSQIEATLHLLDAARKYRYDYIAVISGDTLLLRSDADIKRYLWENRGREFIFRKPLQPHHPDRVRYKHPQGTKDLGPAAKIRYAIQRRLRMLPRNKYFDSLPPLSFGSNWFVITPRFRDYIFEFLGSNPEFSEAFRHSNCGDELFFATIISQSPFAENCDPHCLMYVDWKTGPQYPRTLDESDFDRLEEAIANDGEREHCLFARKFADDIDIEAYRARFIDKTDKTAKR